MKPKDREGTSCENTTNASAECEHEDTVSCHTDEVWRLQRRGAWWSESHAGSNASSRGGYLGCDTLEALYTPSSASTTGSVPRILVRSMCGCTRRQQRGRLARASRPRGLASFFCVWGAHETPKSLCRAVGLGGGCMAPWLGWGSLEAACVSCWARRCAGAELL